MVSKSDRQTDISSREHQARPPGALILCVEKSYRSDRSHGIIYHNYNVKRNQFVYPAHSRRKGRITMLGIPITSVIAARKLHSKALKTAKGRTDRQTSIDTITYLYLMDLYILEGNLLSIKDAIIDYVENFDKKQSSIDDCLSEEKMSDISKTLIDLYTTDFRGALDGLLFNIDVYMNRFNNYVVQHYLRTLVGPEGKKDFFINVPYGELWRDIENNPHYEEVWAKVKKLMDNVDKGGPMGIDHRIFIPDPKCIERYYKLTYGIHHRDDIRIQVFDKYGEPVIFDGRWKNINVSEEIFTEQAEEHKLPGEVFNAIHLPHYDFHGKAKEAPAKPLNTYTTYEITNDGLDWEPELLSARDIVLKNGDIVEAEYADKVNSPVP